MDKDKKNKLRRNKIGKVYKNMNFKLKTRQTCLVHVFDVFFCVLCIYDLWMGSVIKVHRLKNYLYVSLVMVHVLNHKIKTFVGTTYSFFYTLWNSHGTFLCVLLCLQCASTIIIYQKYITGQSRTVINGRW